MVQILIVTDDPLSRHNLPAAGYRGLRRRDTPGPAPDHGRDHLPHDARDLLRTIDGAIVVIEAHRQLEMAETGAMETVVCGTVSLGQGREVHILRAAAAVVAALSETVDRAVEAIPEALLPPLEGVQRYRLFSPVICSLGCLLYTSPSPRDRG